ncbi:MAG: TrgA family protein [Yoonia sp.]|uniref:TrgA family protein n=1 Tax=Yoonia sp. TaxID=2212373 RepID=UPI003EF508AC
MPTAGRLAGALIYGLFCWIMAIEASPFFPQESPPSFFLPLCIIIGIILGWRICGARAGHGYHPAIGIGLTTAFAIGFWIIFAMAFQQMIANTMEMKYRGPMDSVIGVFYEMYNFGSMVFDIPLLVKLFGGGVLCAWFTEFFARRYP